MTPPRAFVIGHPIAHSRSPLIHGTWLETLGLQGSYERIDVPPEELGTFLRSFAARGFSGGNITVPHKSEAMAHVDRIDAAGRAIGAINTVWIENGEVCASNTDAEGFVASLDQEAPGWDEINGRALVYGAGGAARAVVHALLGRGFAVDVVNRTMERARELAEAFGPPVTAASTRDIDDRLAEADFFVNTTSLGMAGMEPLTLHLGALKREAVVCDIVYVPLETDLLRAARGRGHRTVNGLGMLLHQAVPGFAHWFGVRPSVTPGLRAIVEADIAKPRQH